VEGVREDMKVSEFVTVPRWMLERWRMRVANGSLTNVVLEIDVLLERPPYAHRDHVFSPWQADPNMCGLCGKKREEHGHSGRNLTRRLT